VRPPDDAGLVTAKIETASTVGGSFLDDASEPTKSRPPAVEGTTDRGPSKTLTTVYIRHFTGKVRKKRVSL
jgi:hypothetical protein